MIDRDSQLTSSVLMIRPTCFYGNPLTATSNRFQVKTDVSIADQLKKALEEFELFTIALKKCGVEVIEFNDTKEPPKPDAIFPNNWVSFHADGTVVLYPMEAVKTNILGVENLLNNAIKAKVKKIICLSTDKAVYPINAMGVSKSMMEKVITAKSRNSGNTNICITRYGNVIYSRGSVVPLFVKQIKNNKMFKTNNQ